MRIFPYWMGGFLINRVFSIVINSPQLWKMNFLN